MPYDLKAKITAKVATLGHPGARVENGKLILGDGTEVGTITGFITVEKLTTMIDAYNASSSDAEPNG